MIAVRGAPADGVAGPIDGFQGHRLTGHRRHARGAEQGAEQEERTAQLLVGGDVERQIRRVGGPGQIDCGLEHPRLADACLSLENYGAQARSGLRELLLYGLQFPHSPHDRCFRPWRRRVECLCRGVPHLAPGAVAGIPLLSPENLVETPAVGKAFEPEQTAVHHFCRP